MNQFNMYDQKTGINVSAIQGSDRIRGSDSNHPSIDDKKIFESSGGDDSGFLSGQNLFSSESIDTEDIADTVPTAVPDTDHYRDSGAIVADDDDYDLQEDNTKDTKQSPMILPNGVDVGLSEWFCGLNLKNSSVPYNNLSSSRKTQDEQQKYSKQSPNRPLWELCYRQDDDGDTQLHLAILGKYAQAVWAIIRLAPVPEALDIRNDDAHAPLHLAVLTRQHEIVRILLLAGAKASIQDREGNTPLHLACMNSDRACIDALTRPITSEDLQLQYNFTKRIPQVLPPDLEQRNYDGMHCVHIAAQRNDIDTLKHLVCLGADINAREGRSGYTALHFACENSNEELAQFLLSCQTLNVETCTYGLLTAYQLAAEQKNCNLMGNLKSCGAELLSPPDSDDDSFLGSSDDDYRNYESDDCELN